MPALTQDLHKTKGRIVGAGFRPYENEDFLGLHFFTFAGNIVIVNKLANGKAQPPLASLGFRLRQSSAGPAVGCSGR